jgi:hypothetical protein
VEDQAAEGLAEGQVVEAEVQVAVVEGRVAEAASRLAQESPSPS